MYQSAVKEPSIKGVAVYPVLLVIMLLFSICFFFLPEGPGYYAREKYYVLMFPSFAILAGKAAKDITAFIFVGKWSDLISSSLLVLGNGAAAFIFFFFISDSREIRVASLGIIAISISIILNKVSKVLVMGIYSGSIIKVISYLTAGISIKYMFEGIWPGELKSSLGEITLYSFIGISILQMISLIDLSGGEKAGRISLWLKTRHKLKFLGFSILFFLLKDMRSGIVGESVLGTWIFVGVVLLAAFIIIAIILKNAVEHTPEEKLKKHFQSISYEKIKDISNISMYIDDFVTSGNKAGIVSCLYYIACKAGISIGAASRMVTPLLEYKDLQLPGITTRNNFRIVEERNRQNRSIVIESIIYNFELFGRGVGGFDEYRETSGTV